MILTALRLKNFRQYRGLHEIWFAPEGERNVTIVTGANGAGKTNLFLALNWGLYGVGLDGRGQILSKGLTEEQQDGGFVEVHFRHEGIRYIARRDIVWRGSFESTGDLVLTQLAAEGRTRVVPNPQQKMNEILPSDARQYFFFDGERIDEMSKPGHEEQVRDAIRSVLKLKVLERAILHLQEVEREFAQAVKETGTVDDEARRLIERLEQAREELVHHKAKREDLHRESESAKRQLDEVNERLRSMEGIRELKSKEDMLEARLLAAETGASRVGETLAEQVGRAGPAMAAEAAEIARRILDEKRSRGEIPSNIREQLIEDLLRSGRCVCGRSLDAESRRHLQRRKDESVPSQVEDAILSASSHMSGLLSLAESIPRELEASLTGLANFHSEMEDLQREKEEAGERIRAELKTVSGNLFAENLSGLDGTRRELEGRVGDLKYDLGRLDNTIESLDKQSHEDGERLSKTEARSMAAQRDKRRYELATLAGDASEALLERFFSDMRQRIQSRTEEIFKQLIWKERQFADVRILGDYRLDVIDRYGSSALSQLSAGERQILSLAFIVAMSRVTEEEAPLIIDTPFGRISEEPLHNIAGALPSVHGQLVLLVTDRELDEHARKQLEPSIGREYTLEFDDETGITHVAEERLDA